MSVQVEKLEHNMVKLTIEVSAERLDEAMKRSYNKQKNSINIRGFRKGKVPYQMVEKMYGPEVFYGDASDELVQAEYPVAVEECGEEITSVPEIDIVQLEKGKPFIFTAEVAVKPPVTLGKYEGVTVTKIDTTVSEEDIDAAVDRERESNSRLVDVDRAVQDGDTVNIDFAGFCEGEQFEGGTSEGYMLNIGSHSFVDTFEEQLVGAKKGDEVEVNVTFPENYQSEELAGKPAMFKVTINEVKEKQLPDADDEFAMDVSEFDTLAEYRDSLKEKLQKEKEDSARATKEDEAIKKICDKSEMDIPDAMIDTQVRQMMRDLENNLAQTGIPMNMYYQYTNTTEEELKAQCREQAIDQIKYTLVLEAIAKEQKFEITDEEINAEFEKMAEAYGMDAKTLIELSGDREKEQVSHDIEVRKAIDYIMDNCKERAKAKTKKEKEAEAAAADGEEKKEAPKKATRKKSTTTKKTTAKKDAEEAKDAE